MRRCSSTTPTAISGQIFRDLLKRGIKPLAENNAVAVLLDERVFPEIVLVDRTRSRLMDRVAEPACTRPQDTFLRQRCWCFCVAPRHRGCDWSCRAGWCGVHLMAGGKLRPPFHPLS